MQLIPGTIVKIKTSREYGTVIRHSKMSDFIYAIDANPNFPRHYAVLTQNGLEHIPGSKLIFIWSPDQEKPRKENDARK